MQEGLLFHALYDAQAPDIYTVQLDLGLEGALDSAAMAAAVQALVARHASLRARFRHAHLGQPVQVILPQATAPWRCIDLSSLDEAGREERLAAVLAQERAERFDLADAPLIRFALIRLAAERHRLVLTNHHIVMDGWSMPVLVRELLTLYAHRADAAALPRATPYRDYLAWAAAQDRAGALAAWRDALAGLEEATRLAPHDPGREPVAPEQMRLALSEPLTAALTAQARRHGLTLNTVIQTAWAILLGRLTGREDVVFGVTVAGRPPEVAGIESMVGLFINTLPLRVQAAAGHAAARAAAAGAGQPVATDGAPASRPCRGAGAGGIGRAVRHAGGVRELPGGRRPASSAEVGRTAARERQRARCDTLSAEPVRRYRASGCGCASTIAPTCSSARA